MAKRVQVVLNEDILSLGKDGDLVEVAPGYARNFLLPYGKALPVTPAVIKQVQHRRAKKAAKKKANSTKKANANAGTPQVLPIKVGTTVPLQYLHENNQIYFQELYNYIKDFNNDLD